ncbi:MAG TPA: hypothetical protein VFZ11_15455 [Gemmatimonadaceae bacterium]
MGERQKQHMGRSTGDEREVAGRDVPVAEGERRASELAEDGDRPRVARGEPNAETEGLRREEGGDAG